MPEMFDPNQFADMQIEGQNDTKLVPVPEGEYPAVIDKYEFRKWQKRDDPGINGVSLDVTWSIDDENVKQVVGRDKVLVRQSIGIDFTETGGIDMGKGRNVGLGRLRTAIGQNKPGVWAFSMLPGSSAKVNVTHRIDDRPTAEPGDVFAEIKSVTALV